jgi:hypothetical protein
MKGPTGNVEHKLCSENKFGASATSPASNKISSITFRNSIELQSVPHNTKHKNLVIYIHIYIYIERERERKRERLKVW